MTLKRLVIIVAILLVIAAAGLVIAARMLLGGDAVRAAIEQQATAALGRPVSIRSAWPHVFPRPGIDLGGVTIGGAGEIAIERVILSTGLRALLGRRIEDGDVLVEGTRIDVPRALVLLGALAQQPELAAGQPAPSAGVALVSVTGIALRRVDLVAGSRTLRVDMQSSLVGPDRLQVARMDVRGAGTDLRGGGEFSSISSGTGTFTIDATTLDLDGLLAFMAAATPAGRRTTRAREPSTAVPLNVTIAARAATGRVAEAGFSDLSTTCRLKGADARLDDLRLSLFGGRFNGSIAVVGSGREPRYEWRGSFDQLDAAQLAAFAGTSGSLTGRLGGNVALSSSGPTPDEAIRRARGNARIAITDGRMPGLQVVRAVVLAFGKPSGERPTGSGEAFSKLAATLAIADQRLSTNDLTFASRDFDMAAKGTLLLASQALSFQADLLLSRELSAQAGRDLYRLAREDDRIVLPARIGGTVAAPTVFIDIQAALERALRNRAKEEVKSLFDRLKRKIIK